MATKKKTEDIEETTPEVIAEETFEAAEVPETDEATQVVATEEPKTAKAGKRSAKAVREAEAEEARQEAKAERAVSDEAAAHEPKAPRRTMPNPLKAHGKKYREAAKLVDRTKLHPLAEALELAAKTATTKFDSSVELHVNLGVDPRQADQMVRASVVLPYGTGKTLRVAVFADGEAADKAKAAGADLVGTDKLLADIEKGKLEFDILIATPDKMATLGKAAKVLGPRGLMPNPKSGTVTPDTAKAVSEAKAGKVEFRIDKQAILHQAVGKVSFKPADLRANAEAFLGAVLKAKPSAAKGTYVKAVTVTTSMGPGIKVDAAATVAELSGKK
jgi:ribosomal protein L1